MKFKSKLPKVTEKGLGYRISSVSSIPSRVKKVNIPEVKEKPKQKEKKQKPQETKKKQKDITDKEI